MNSSGVLGIIAIAFIVWCFSSKGKSRPVRPMRLHYHNVGRTPAWKVKRHEEGGHKRAANRLGCYGRVRADDDGGYTFVPTSGRWGQLTPVENAAIYYAGRAAAGAGGHEEDDEGAKESLRQVSWSQRGVAAREAWHLAKRLVR